MEDKTPSPAPTEPFKVTDDLLRDLDSGKVMMDSLPKDQHQAVMAHLKAELLSPGATDTELETPAAEPADTTPSKDAKPAAKPIDLKAIRESIQKESNEAHKLEQLQKRLADEKKRKEDAKKKLEEESKKEPTQPADHLSDDHQRTLVKEHEEIKRELADLRAREKAREDEAISRLENEVNETAVSQEFAELEEMQKEYEQLKTETPLQKLNAKYATWLDSLVEKTGVKAGNEKADQNALRGLALDKWNADPELQKTIPEIEEMDKLDILLALHKKKQTQGGTIEGHWLQHLKRNGTLDKVINRERVEGAKDGAAKTIAALTKPDTEIQTLSPTDGATRGNEPGGEMTFEKASKIIQNSRKIQDQGHRLTPAQRQENQQALAFLSVKS